MCVVCVMVCVHCPGTRVLGASVAGADPPWGASSSSCTLVLGP